MMKKIIGIIGRCAVYLLVIGITIVATIGIYNAQLAPTLFGNIAVEWNDSVGTEVSDLKYAEGEFHDYDLYLPNNKQAHSLILFIHGGSFTGGDKKDEAALCKFYTSKGYVTATVNYSLHREDKSADLNMMYKELLQSVGAIKDECKKRGIHLDGMATCGHSAGGCLALLYAYRAKDASPIPVKFVFEQTGPVDFEPEGWGQTENDGKAMFASMMTGRTITAEMVRSGKYHDYVAEVSPASWVDSTSVPTLCAYGPRDKVVPAQIKFKLLDRLKKYGVKHDYIEFSNSGHGMLSDPDKHELFNKTSLEYCEKYF